MIVCLCRCLSDRRLEQAIAAGASTVGEVFKAEGCVPQCGSCVPVVRDLIAAAREALAPALCPALAVAAE